MPNRTIQAAVLGKISRYATNFPVSKALCFFSRAPCLHPDGIVLFDVHYNVLR